jgi:excisionase family DNA binding protein
MKGYLTTAHVAAELGVSEETVRGYVRRGVIPVTRTPGGHARYDMADVRAVLALRPHIRTIPALEPGEIRIGASERPMPHGSWADDLRIGALELETPVGDLPTWPGRSGSARVLIPRHVSRA